MCNTICVRVRMGLHYVSLTKILYEVLSKREKTAPQDISFSDYQYYLIPGFDIISNNSCFMRTSDVFNAFNANQNECTVLQNTYQEDVITSWRIIPG